VFFPDQYLGAKSPFRKTLVKDWNWLMLQGKYFPEVKINVLYDVAHNIAKFEEHKINRELYLN